MKAEALIMKGQTYWDSALEIINQVRERVSLPSIDVETSEIDELDMLEFVLYEREMEFSAEAKRWYDLLRFGRAQNYKYKDNFINIIVESNQTTNKQWINSVLKSNDAHFLPLPESEILNNPLLIQNPYYATTK
jgi:hypothetical protein